MPPGHSEGLSSVGGHWASGLSSPGLHVPSGDSRRRRRSPWAACCPLSLGGRGLPLLRAAGARSASVSGGDSLTGRRVFSHAAGRRCRRPGRCPLLWPTSSQPALAVDAAENLVFGERQNTCVCGHRKKQKKTRLSNKEAMLWPFETCKPR